MSTIITQLANAPPGATSLGATFLRGTQDLVDQPQNADLELALLVHVHRLDVRNETLEEIIVRIGSPSHVDLLLLLLLLLLGGLTLLALQVRGTGATRAGCLLLLQRILARNCGRRGVHGGTARVGLGYRCVGEVLVTAVLGFDYVG